MKTLHRIRRMVVLMIVVAAALALFALVAYAESDSPSAGGIFTVNIRSDGNDGDNLGLSLREAMLLARGGTGPQGLNRLLTTSEVIHIQGCQLGIDFGSGNASIMGGCGAGMPDTIRFQFWDATTDNIIQVYSALPPIDDSAPTLIDGESVHSPILDFSTNPMTPGLTVNSSNNMIKGLKIRGGRCNNGNHCPALAGLDLWGHNNLIANVTILDVQGHGIFVEGRHNTIDGVRIGVPHGNVSKCPLAVPNSNTGVSGHGIYLSTGAENTVIKNSVIGCNGLWSDGSGIYVTSGNGGTVIGPNNKIGTLGNGSSVLLGNDSSGITLNQSQNVTIISNTIAYNYASGIALANSSNNVIGGNLIRDNNGDGVLMIAASANNKIGGPTPGSVYGGNKIGFNNSNGIYLLHIPAISSTPPTGNVIVGNWIGTLNLTGAAANKGSGILLNGAVDTKIGEAAPAAPNIISGNAQQGIWLRGGANGNRVMNSYIGINGFAPLPNAQNGILLEEGSHHNFIGGLVASNANMINHNGEVGVLLRGAGTSTNSLLSNTIAKNGLEGVLITAQASNNIIGSTGLAAVAYNQIAENGRSGVALTNGAQKNSIGSNTISRNSRAGILFDGAATQHNTIALAAIFENKGASGDGIAQANGAANNSWSRISAYDNDGLGIDVEAVTGFNTVTGPYPTITKITSHMEGLSRFLIITGTATSSLINERSVTVEVYRVADDPSSYGEGQTFAANGQTDANGNFALKYDGLPGCFTAFQTVSEGNSKRSSEFGPNFCMMKNQVINFSFIQDKYVGDAAFTVNPVATSGLPVSVTASGSCTVNAQKLVTLTGTGTCTLKAQQAGNETFIPASDVYRSFFVLKKGQTISWGSDGASQSQFVDAQPFALNATANSGLSVAFEAQGVCTVNGNMVTLAGLPGNCELIANQPGNDSFYPAQTVEKSFAVSKKDQSLAFTQLPNKPVTDPPFAVSASASSGLAVQFESTTPTVCTVSNNTVTLIAAGDCSLMASQPGNAIFNPAQPVTQSFLVQPAKPNQPGQPSLFLPMVSR
ncbi:MAG: right-handed parallel beta-helix repeat-containing protein [Caldilineaceae bacterium]|nr:right-handed parallel beta-helix repeat-containing protein [Caldilineaceae bacterium]